MFMENVNNLNDLINYQEGVVASRTLLNKNAGTVTLFAFDQSQGLSEHTAPFDAMAYIVDGEAEITIKEQKYHLKVGETIIMPANMSHKVYAVNQFKMLLIMIKSE